MIGFITTLTANETKQNYFKPNFSYSNISINYLDWTTATQERSGKKSFTYVELEGGAGWDWGEVYMFIDLENPTKHYSDDYPDNKRYALKPVVDVKLFGTNFNIHFQDYMFYSEDFYVNNLVLGISYKLTTDFGFWIQPFIGPHYQKSTYYSGFNGYIAGWVFGYDFKLLSQKFSFSQWHEEEFNRNKEDYEEEGEPIGDGLSHGTQGAFCIWWHPISEITTGVQYRYANHKLGFNGYQASFIYSLKYNF